MKTGNNIKSKIPKYVKTVMESVKNKGFEIYLIGGSIRDILLGKETKDFDFATNAYPEDILKIFPKAFYENRFGTVGLSVKYIDENSASEEVLEITTYRKESCYENYRHPSKVIWGKTIEEDLSRRDFTVNAFAWDGRTIIDNYSGLEDLKNKLIKTVGSADERFKEDALRMMRAIRFAAQLGFSIEKSTLSAIKKNSPLIFHISEERVRDEFFKILVSPFASDGIIFLKNTALLEIILPELDRCFDVEQKSPKRHHVFDVGTHLVQSLKNCPSENPIVRFACLIHDVGKAPTFNKTSDGIITFYNHEIIGSSIAQNIAFRLKLSKEQREKLVRLVRYHQFTVDEKQTDSAVRRFIKNTGKENIQDMLDLRTADRLGGGAKITSWRLELFKKRIEEVQKQPFSVSDLAIGGREIMKVYDISPGPLVGKVLEILFKDVIEKKTANTKKDLLQRLQSLKKVMLGK